MKFKLKSKDKYQRFTVIDSHTEGEPLRVITSGYPVIEGDTILKKRQYVAQNLDHFRQLLMYEPRGHADMYGALITDAISADGDFGILFMHNEGYSSMCGHGILATVTAMYECDELTLNAGESKTIRIDSPAGRITAYAKLENDKLHTSFDCVPSFVEVTNQSVHIPNFGDIPYDIAFGGAYYAYIDADLINVDCIPENSEQLTQLGRSIKQVINQNYVLIHPEHKDLAFLYGIIFTSKKVTHSSSHSRHVCIFANGELDRSPTGTGVSGRIALLHHKSEVEISEKITIESIISSSMQVSAVSELDYFGKEAVIPQVSGRAFITGKSEFLVDPDDPFKHGFLLR